VIDNSAIGLRSIGPALPDRFVDSLSILHLLAKVEELTGRAVPDHLVVMRNFQTAEAIAETFCRA
jgi:acyl carrier protein